MEAIVLLHSFRKVVLNKKDIVSSDKKILLLNDQMVLILKVIHARY